MQSQRKEWCQGSIVRHNKRCVSHVLVRGNKEILDGLLDQAARDDIDTLGRIERIEHGHKDLASAPVSQVSYDRVCIDFRDTAAIAHILVDSRNKCSRKSRLLRIAQRRTRSGTDGKRVNLLVDDRKDLVQTLETQRLCRTQHTVHAETIANMGERGDLCLDSRAILGDVGRRNDRVG